MQKKKKKKKPVSYYTSCDFVLPGEGQFLVFPHLHVPSSTGHLDRNGRINRDLIVTREGIHITRYLSGNSVSLKYLDSRKEPCLFHLPSMMLRIALVFLSHGMIGFAFFLVIRMPCEHHIRILHGFLDSSWFAFIYDF